MQASGEHPMPNKLNKSVLNGFRFSIH